jgi:hypothetical protein
VVVLLTRSPALTKKPVSHLTPEVSFEGDRYLLMTSQLAGVNPAPIVGSRATELGSLAGSFAESHQDPHGMWTVRVE